MAGEEPKPKRRRVRVERGIYKYDNGKYAVCVTVGGKPRFKTIGTKLTEARKARERLSAAAQRGELAPPSKLTFAEVARAWLTGFEEEVAAGEKAPRTLEHYRHDIEKHVIPFFGQQRKIRDITVDDVAQLVVTLRRKGLAAWTIRGALTPLGRIFNHAVRRGYVVGNPVRQLDANERPRTSRREQRVLNHDEIRSLLDSSLASYRILLATATYTGMRLSEVLGLTWREVDFETAVIRVRYQLSRAGQRTRLKSGAAVRDVPLMTQLATALRQHKLASPYSRDSDFVFATGVGTPHNYRNVERRGLDKAAARANLNSADRPKLRFHDLRHTFASHLVIDLRLDVAQVSRILGHAKPGITLDVYTHLFDQASHAEDIRNRMSDSAFGSLLDQNLTSG